jgi:hypothetical protein
MVIRTCSVSLFALFFAVPALADDAHYADPDTSVSAKERPRDRFGAVGNAGLGIMSRAVDSSGGPTFGGDVSYMFAGTQGVRVGYAYALGIFGPEIHVADIDYSWQYNTSRELKRVTGSFGLVLGPSVGFVSYLGNNPDNHVSFGGRAGAFADMHIWNFTLGVDGSYRFGFASGYGAEGFGSLGVHAGLTFDIARR